jgi:ribosome biogenesis protein BRX1
MLNRKRKRADRDVAKYINKQRTLVFSSRGITLKGRHFLKDLLDLLPHSKKDVKLDSKDKLFVINEVCELRSCNNCIFFEARKKKDLYMWISRIPTGPSAKFLVQNLHTMEEVKLTGNCLKGSRPLLVFDKNFDTLPYLQLLKELFSQVWGTPKGHPKAKPFVDHVISFFWLDNRIWFRNFQLILEADDTATSKKEPALVEIGPRFVLNPVRIFEGSFGGPTLWENPLYISPNTTRSMIKRQKAGKVASRQQSKTNKAKSREEHQIPTDELEDVFTTPQES